MDAERKIAAGRSGPRGALRAMAGRRRRRAVTRAGGAGERQRAGGLGVDGDGRGVGAERQRAGGLRHEGGRGWGGVVSEQRKAGR